MKINKIITTIQNLNDKLTVTEIAEGKAVAVDHAEYGHICIVNTDEDLDLVEEIVRDELFDKSEAAK